MSFVKKIGALSLLITVDGAEGMQAEQMLAINQKIDELASTMHEAMGDSDISYAQIQESIKNHVGVRFIKDIAPEESEKPSIIDYLNLQGEDRIKATAKPKHHHKHHKHHHKHAKKDKKAAPAKLAHTQPPAQKTFTQAQTQEFTSQMFSVPIDEVKAITMKVSTTYARDEIDSVTLKAFRKVIGYDTFNSILKGDRDEAKDTDDHYNITVSMMVRRIPEQKADPTPNAYNGGELIAPKLDKGFPYDDDGDVSESTQSFKKHVPQAKTNLAVLNGENVTKESLVNLVKDASSPVTQELVQLEKSDSDNLSSLLGENITRGALKNLVTDKPAPITMKLAQTNKLNAAAFALMDNNVSTQMLKNLVTDMPAPITTKLAQVSSGSMAEQLVQLEKKGNPTATVGGATVEGMVGDEEVHGPAMVGGSAVTYKKDKKN